MKLGISGTSSIARLFTDAAIKAGFVPVAVSSRKKETGMNFIERYGGGAVYDNVTDMASSVDVVYIATPPSVHYEQALAAVGAGASVIVEKPCFCTPEQLKTVLAEAKKRGVVVLEAMRLFYSPLTRILRDALPAVGPVRHVCFNYMSYSSKYDDFKNGVIASSFSAELGGGALSDLGVYAVYAALLLFGNPQDSGGTRYREIRLPGGADGTATLILGYNEFNCVINVSKRSSSHVPSEIQGEKGSLLIGNPFMRSDVFFQSGDERVLICNRDFDDMLEQQKALYGILSSRDEENIRRANEFMTDSTAILYGCRNVVPDQPFISSSVG